eukprot:TRINITY_DN39412_c0_g1_i1.p1 TRINITY_DN39412_c0_g1~~TRINITY_DN39412_c0_g1_i1.p1  ORF type:complete len:1097 (-),score=171.44 TRINITY_DN39412_c0_g1_i1:256-3147(-)
MDDVAHQVMNEHGFNSVLCEAGTCRQTDIKDDIWKMRWFLMRTLTGFGLSVLVVDADIVFLGDPTKELTFDADMEVMTDHFFPERHLWEPWVRVEDHINTGFVFVRPSLPVRALIHDFLHANWDSEQGGVQRDGMDQRVFNHFVVRRMSSDVPTVYGVYGDQVFGRPQQIVPLAPMRQVRIRILNPARISHGMNFFWRRAHLLDPSGGAVSGSDVSKESNSASMLLPPVAHVNGADPKEYFLRDRQVWFVDDWSDRFGDDPRFVVYTHPRGLSLSEDFSHLAAAVEVARLLDRRVVLPATMNCQNSPAYVAWGLNITVQREWETGNCTFDYFSWAKHLLQNHEEHVVESSLRLHEMFVELTLSMVALPPALTWPQAIHDVEGTTQWLEALLPRSPALVEIHENIIEVRDALRHALGRGEWNSLDCIFQQFPHQVSVCRDDRYVGRFGQEARCDPAPGQAACGLVGFTCCMAFWGFSEKLEIFTGVRWDLPCNCGLGGQCALTRVHGIDKEDQQYDRHCCAHSLQLPSPREQCMLVPRQQEVTIYGDSHFSSSYLMVDFLERRIDPPRAFQRCKDHRAGTLLDADPARAQLNCNHMFVGFTLWHGRFDRTFRWLEYMHWERRKAGASFVPLSVETGLADGASTLDEWKLRHDLEQLRYIAKRPPRPQITPYAPVVSPDFARRLADAYVELLARASKGTHGLVPVAEGSLPDGLSSLSSYLNRAVHVPHVERLEEGATNPQAKWVELEADFERDGLAFMDEALRPAALEALREYLLESTVWYSSRHGPFVKAQLRDGLHAELLLQIAAELMARLPRALDGPRQHLVDVYANRYDTDWPGPPGLGVHSLPAEVAVALWTTPSAASLDRKGNGYEVFRASAPQNWTATERYAFAQRLEDDSTKQKLLSDDGFTSRHVPHSQNRLVVWRADRLFRTDWRPRLWRGGFKNRRVDLWLLFGSPSEVPTSV